LPILKKTSAHTNPMKTFYKILFFFFISINCFGQISLFKNSSYHIDNESISNFNLKDTSTFRKANERLFLPKFSTFRLKFHLDAKTKNDSTLYIFFNSQGYVKLFQINGSTTKLVGETGHTCPYHRRSIRDEISFIKLDIRSGESLDYLLEVKNFNIEHNHLGFLVYNYAQYQEIKLSQKDTFVNKYGQPIFLGVVVLILLITLIQCILFREKIYFIYFFYIIFILLRVAMNISLLVVEDFFPALREVGFISRFSQTFAFLSIITYLFFIREFANTRQKAPKFDKFLRFQILFMAFYLFVELFAVVEKYTVPLYISIHAGFELVETILGIITIVGLLRLYDKQNKYLIWGVVFLFLVAFVGQQILLRVSSLSRMEQDVYLQVLWGIAYLGEMIFFTLGLFSRAAIMQQTIALQAIENQKLMQALSNSQEKDHNIQPDTLNIATNKGTIIIQQADICRVEASGNYTVFYVNNQKQVMASNTMAEFEDKLNTDRFIRVHKSHIVNLRFVVKYTKGDGGSLTLQDGSEIPVSRSRKDELLKKLFAE
jgi:two-component system, sensor histidine kinase LadS